MQEAPQHFNPTHHYFLHRVEEVRNIYNVVPFAVMIDIYLNRVGGGEFFKNIRLKSIDGDGGASWVLNQPSLIC